MNDIRIVLVEDDPIQLAQLRTVLGSTKGLVVAGAFADAEKALKAMDELKPDILLSDLGLQGMSGLELIRRVNSDFPAVDIIALTVHEDTDTVFKAIKSGAWGYLLKSSSREELIDAIFDAKEGGSRMTPKIARKIIMYLQMESADAALQPTPREVEVLRKIEIGRTYKEIANEIGLSVNTINSHVKRVFGKLHARNKQEAIFFAKKRGIL